MKTTLLIFMLCCWSANAQNSVGFEFNRENLSGKFAIYGEHKSVSEYKDSNFPSLIGNIIEHSTAFEILGKNKPTSSLKGEIKFSSKQKLNFKMLYAKDENLPKKVAKVLFKEADLMKKQNITSAYTLEIEFETRFNGIKKTTTLLETMKGNQVSLLINKAESKKFEKGFLKKHMHPWLMYHCMNGFHKREYDKKNRPQIEIKLKYKSSSVNINFKNFYNNVEEVPIELQPFLRKIKVVELPSVC